MKRFEEERRFVVTAEVIRSSQEICRLPKKVFIGIVAIMILVAAVAVGVSVGIAGSNSSSNTGAMISATEVPTQGSTQTPTATIAKRPTPLPTAIPTAVSPLESHIMTYAGPQLSTLTSFNVSSFGLTGTIPKEIGMHVFCFLLF